MEGRTDESKLFDGSQDIFKVRFNIGDPKTLSCKKFNGGSKKFTFPDGRFVANSWDVNWKTSWDPSKPCECVMQKYQGYIPAFDPKLMPQFAKQNEENKRWCESIYQRGWMNQSCSHYKP